MVGGNPYTESKKGSVIKRTFSKNVDSDELVWHRDHHTRRVKIVQGEGWQFQSDGNIPEELYEGKEIIINKNTYHRLIKGATDLVVNIWEK